MLDLLFVSLFQAASGDPAVTPSADQPAATTTDQAQTTPPAQQQRRRCRNVRQTGTYMSVRVCRTAEEEARLEQNMRRDVEEAIDRRSTPPESLLEATR